MTAPFPPATFAAGSTAWRWTAACGPATTPSRGGGGGGWGGGGGELPAFKYLQPADFSADLDGKAFHDNLGEFTLHSFPVEPVVSTADFFVQSLEALGNAAAVRRLMVVADMDAYGDRVRRAVAAFEGKDVTLFAMEPLSGRGFQQEILGYSLMNALGIRADELP